MKKHLLCIAASVALLGLSPSAFAQSSVTLYGRVNTTVEHTKLTDAKARTHMLNNGSNLGFLGEEDLGGGLKAGFQFEMDIDSTDGAAEDGYASNAEVWLAGDWGRVRLGNYGGQSMKTIVEETSLHNDNVGTSADWLFADLMPADHRFSYVTPEFGGFTLELGMSLKDDRKTVDGVNAHAYELVANYDVGDLSLAASYVHYDQAKQLSLRGLYTLGDFQFGGYYQRDENGWIEGAGARNNYRLVGIYTFGNNEIHLNAGHASAYKHVADSSATQWTLAWNYNLSKRTKFYALYTHLDNAKGATYGKDLGVERAGQDFRSFGIGLRHYF